MSQRRRYKDEDDGVAGWLGESEMSGAGTAVVEWLGEMELGSTPVCQDSPLTSRRLQVSRSNHLYIAPEMVCSFCQTDLC